MTTPRDLPRRSVLGRSVLGRSVTGRSVTGAVVTLLAALLSLCATPHPAHTAGWPETVRSAPGPGAHQPGPEALQQRDADGERPTDADGADRAEEHWQAAPVHLAVLQQPLEQPASGGPGPALPARAVRLPAPATHSEPAPGHSESPAAGARPDALPEVRGPPDAA